MPMGSWPKMAKVKLSWDSYGEIAYEIAAPAHGLILEILARAGIDPSETN